MSERVAMLSVEDAIETAKEMGIRESMAKVNAYRMLLNNPQLARGVNELLTTLLFTNKTIDVRLREQRFDVGMTLPGSRVAGQSRGQVGQALALGSDYFTGTAQQAVGFRQGLASAEGDAQSK